MTSKSSNTDEQIKGTAETLRAQHGKVGGVPIDRGGLAFFRSPTPDEYDEFRSLDGTTESRKAYRAMIRACYLGALIGGEWLGPDSIGDVAGREGPGWLSAAAGDCVNTLAGMKVRGPAVFF